MNKLRVNDVMSAGALSVGADTRVQDVARIVARYGSVAVIDRDGVVVGLVEPSDVDCERVRRWVLRGLLARREGGPARPRGGRARDVMRRSASTVTPDVSVLEAAHMLVRLRAARLPVVDDERRLVGSVDATGVLRTFLRPDQELVDQITREVLGGAAADVGAVRVDAEDGVVTLRGRVPRRSLVRDAVRLAGAVDGVVRVVDRLTFTRDDTAGVPPEGNPTTGSTGTGGV